MLGGSAHWKDVGTVRKKVPVQLSENVLGEIRGLEDGKGRVRSTWGKDPNSGICAETAW